MKIKDAIILRYDNSIRLFIEEELHIRLSTKPEPWIHVGFFYYKRNGASEYCNAFDIVLYTWDTREIIEYKQYFEPATGPNGLMRVYENLSFESIKDSLEPLTGSGNLRIYNETLKLAKELRDNK